MTTRSVIRTLVHRSVVGGSAADVFRWHERRHLVVRRSFERAARGRATDVA